jgi:23S rRNA pseudouridine2605 synthase
MRIQRALARAGVASRRKAEELIAAGRVRVNGDVARTGQIVDPSRDEIVVDGRKVEPPRGAVWYALNKPAGVMTTRSDPDGRRTVFELVPDVRGLTYVGRLDYLTEGLLLLTTDGEAAHRLSHPRGEIERTYVATVIGKGDEAARVARSGVMLDDGPVHPRRVVATNVGRDRWDFEVTITEGRKREVRRLCTALGLGVERLVRTRFGPISLGNLPSGAVRELTAAERAALGSLGAPGPTPPSGGTQGGAPSSKPGVGRQGRPRRRLSK